MRLKELRLLLNKVEDAREATIYVELPNGEIHEINGLENQDGVLYLTVKHQPADV